MRGLLRTFWRLGAENAEGLREAGDTPKRVDRGLLKWTPAGKICDASPLAYGPIARLGARWRYFIFGERPEPVPSHRGPVEEPREGKTGICCSGGGIRSAAYNLGALQALQESKERELQNAHYLAAVSGGSYICAAYSMVGKMWPKDRRRPEDDPDDPCNGHDDSDPTLLEHMAPFARNSPEEQYLRNRSSYMAPDTRAKLYLGIRILLGLIFNVAFLALPIAVVTVFAGILIYGPSLSGLLPGCGDSCGFHPGGWWLGLPLLLLGLGLLVGVRFVRRPGSDRQRELSEVWSTRLIMWAGAVALVSLAIPALVGLLQQHSPKVLEDTVGGPAPTAVGAGGAGLAGLIAGLVAYLREAFSTPRKAIDETKAARSWLMKLSGRMRTAVIYLAGALAGPVLLLAIAVLVLSATLDHYHSDRTALWLLGVGGALVFFTLYWLVDLTSWSLHPFYKRRLCTAFALKRVRPGLVTKRRGKAAIRQELDEGVAVERDYDRHVPLSDTALDAWPALIVCAAANISDSGATPPGRRVTSFTFSANSVGGPLVGAMETQQYEDAFGEKRTRDFSLPAAVAMSGAAVSPSMGKMSRPAFRFLLALANIRLGVWLPNPRWVARSSTRERKLFRQPRPSYLIRELLGRNSVDGKYLYVTDGGHYENLGLVELLRRGCMRVFCFDASGGEKFSELGDAVALARSELGVKIEIDPTPLSPTGKPPTASRDTTTGTIYYPTGEKGYIVYARNVMSPGGPWDVRAHQLDDPTFPHDSTVDQLYTDQKFESYRALGAEAGRHAVERMNDVAPGGPRKLLAPEADCALPPQRVRELLDTATVQLVDLREDFAYGVARIDGARHIELAKLPESNGGLRKEHPVVFHCGEGVRSCEVATQYRRDGWNAFHLEGGIRRWIDDGFPVDRTPKEAAAANGG